MNELIFRQVAMSCVGCVIKLRQWHKKLCQASLSTELPLNPVHPIFFLRATASKYCEGQKRGAFLFSVIKRNNVMETELSVYFSEIEDPRVEGRCLHLLSIY
jgi:hypothetical protein